MKKVREKGGSKEQEPDKAEERKEHNYEIALSQADENIQRFLELKNDTIPKLAQTVKNLEVMIPEINKWREQPDNRTTEVVKRMALGIVVSSFFLAILRYVAGIYRSYNQQMLRAEYEDLAVRRFYVAYKGAGFNTEIKKAVLSAFINSSVPVSQDGNSDTSSLSKAETDFLTNILKNVINRS